MQVHGQSRPVGERRLGQQHPGPGGQPRQRVGGPGLPGVDQRAGRPVETDGVRLDRVGDACHPQGEAAQALRTSLAQWAEVERPLQLGLARVVDLTGPGDPVPRAGGGVRDDGTPGGGRGVGGRDVPGR
ncbi:hypothetical protein SDC9_137865 [bioreactor metagenome]|uniref:Uncharacterized protein n=1 Tax=bioreactor metagenome TaxID=1076179 RepID=A0A645DPP5_9ZZZZ